MAKPYLREAITFGQRSVKTNFQEMERLKRQFAENLVNLGKAVDAAIWVEKEEMNKTILREGNLDARILLRTGKLREAKQFLETELRTIRSCQIHIEKQMYFYPLFIP